MRSTMHGMDSGKTATVLRLQAIQDEAIRKLMDREYMLRQKTQASDQHLTTLNKRIELREVS